MPIELTEVTTITDPVNLDGVQGFGTYTQGGTTYLYTAAHAAAALSVYRLGSDGTPTRIQTVFDDADTFLTGVYELSVIEAQGRSFLLAGGLNDVGFSVFEIGADGRLTNIQNIADTVSAPIAGNYGKAVTWQSFGRSFVAWPSNTEDGIATFEVLPDGTFVSTGGSVSGLAFDGLRNLETVEIAGETLIVGAAGVADGLIVLETNVNGTVTARTNFTNSVLDGAADVAAVVLDGQTYVISTAFAADRLTSLVLSTAGININFTVASSVTGTFLDGAFDLSAIEIGGGTYLGASAFNADRFNVYSMEENGFARLQTFVTDTADLALDAQGAHQFVRIGTDIFAYVSGRNDDGFSVFRIDMPVSLSQGGTVYEVSGTVMDALSVARPGSLIAVVDPSDSGLGSVVPVSAEIAVDDLRITGLSDGHRSFYGTLTGVAQSVSFAGETNIWLRGQSDVNNDLRTGAGDDTHLGYGGDDTLLAGAGVDTLLGGAGRDRMDGAGGADSLFGGGGNDTMTGGAQNDWLAGNVGADLMLGGVGLDSLFGGTGDDTLFGGGGDDSLQGFDGDDALHGEDGIDMLEGLQGNDTLDGGAQTDFLYGGAGADLLMGGDGYDALYGGEGNDTVAGGDVEDELFGNRGRDLILGERGNDTMRGGEGADTLNGGQGNDQLIGGPGNDRLVGGPGQDDFLFRLNEGDDTVAGFEDDLDVLVFPFASLGVANGTQLLATYGSEQGADVVIDLAGTGSVRVENITLAALANDIEGFG